MNISRAIAIGLICLLLAGCQSASPPGVLTRLPNPALAETPSPVPPRPSSISPPPVSPAAPANWMPPAGISNRWTSIVVHHSASDIGSLHDIDAWHRGKGWDSCGYHFVIGNGTHSGDGQIEVGPRWQDQATGAHTRLYGSPSSPQGNYYNEHGIGIVLVGNFDHAGPSPRQQEALVTLVSWLCQTCHVPLQHVYVHGELKSTECPGRFFPKSRIRQRLATSLARSNAKDERQGG